MAGPGQNQPQKKSALATYGTIDSSSLERQLWLARVQPTLFQLWDEAPEGTHLGTLTFTKGTPVSRSKTNVKSNLKKQPSSAVRKSNGTKISSVKPAAAAAAAAVPTKTKTTTTTKPIQQRIGLQISQELIQASGEKAKDLPLEYTITNLTSKIPTLHPFTRNSTNGKVELHGTISRSCNLQIDRNQKYRDLCKKRILGTIEKDRFVKPIGTSDVVLSSTTRVAGKDNGFGNNVASFGKQMQEAQKELQNDTLSEYGSKKRKFSETQSIKSILFELFSRRDYWSFKELKSASGGRADPEIKQGLKDIAEFRRAGENKGLWALKKEYAGEAKIAASSMAQS